MNETKGTILVVDDEELVLDVEVTLLQRIGYNTLVARNSREACQLFKDKNEQNNKSLHPTFGHFGKKSLRKFNFFQSNLQRVNSVLNLFI